MNEESVRIYLDPEFGHTFDAPGVDKICCRNQFLTCRSKAIFYSQRYFVILDPFHQTVGYKLLELLAEDLFTDWKSLLGIGKPDIAIMVDVIDNTEFPLSRHAA